MAVKSISKQGRFTEGQNRANITPLADVTTILIVVFLITMPAIMWNGIQIHTAEASSEQQVLTPAVKTNDQIITVTVEPDGVRVGQERVDLADLEGLLTARLALRPDKTVVVVPADRVSFGDVVTVMDIAKASGAEQLALLNEIDKEH